MNPLNPRWFLPLRAHHLHAIVLAGAVALTLAACGGSSDPVGPRDPVPPAPGGVGDGPLPAGDYLFVLSRVSREVSILRGAAGYEVVRRIALPTAGTAPRGLEVDPAAGRLYVSFPDSQTTVVALSMDGVELARTQVDGWAPDLALDATRGLLVVAAGTGVEFLDAATLSARARVKTGTGRSGAWNVALDPEAAVAVVSQALDDEVTRVSLDDFSVLGRTGVDAYPEGLALLGGAVYVASNDADRLDVVGLADGALRASIPTANGPSSVAADPIHGRVFVANDLSGEVAVIGASSGAEVARWSRGHALPELAMSLDGALVFAAHPGASAVEILEATSGEEVGSVAIGGSPTSLRAVRLP